MSSQKISASQKMSANYDLLHSDKSPFKAYVLKANFCANLDSYVTVEIVANKAAHFYKNSQALEQFARNIPTKLQQKCSNGGFVNEITIWGRNTDKIVYAGVMHRGGWQLTPLKNINNAMYSDDPQAAAYITPGLPLERSIQRLKGVRQKGRGHRPTIRYDARQKNHEELILSGGTYFNAYVRKNDITYCDIDVNKRENVIYLDAVKYDIVVTVIGDNIDHFYFDEYGFNDFALKILKVMRKKCRNLHRLVIQGREQHHRVFAAEMKKASNWNLDIAEAQKQKATRQIEKDRAHFGLVQPKVAEQKILTAKESRSAIIKWEKDQKNKIRAIRWDEKFETEYLNGMRGFEAKELAKYDKKILDATTPLAQRQAEFERTIYACHVYSSHPQDHNRYKDVAGYTDEMLDIETAIDECMHSRKLFEYDNDILNYQLGRVAYLAGFYQEAQKYLSRPANKGYGLPLYYIGLMRLEGLGDLQQNIEEALYDLEASAATGFTPAIALLNELTRDDTNQKPYQHIAHDKEHILPHLINDLMTGELYSNAEFSIASLYLVEMLNTYNSVCEGMMDPQDMGRVKDKIHNSHASKGYKKHVREGLRNNPSVTRDDIPGLRRIAEHAMNNEHPNNALKKHIREIEAPTDAMILINEYNCDGEESLEFIARAIEFIDTAPPYNYVSPMAWNTCMAQTPIGTKVFGGKEKFCGCFLGIARGDYFQHALLGGDAKAGLGELFNSAFFGARLARVRLLSHDSGNKLLTNFRVTAQQMMDSEPRLMKCKG